MRTATLLCSTAFIALSAASAQAAVGWYVGLEAGWNWLNDNDGDFHVFDTFDENDTTFFDRRDRINFDDGWAILGTAGYSWGHWRVEGEVGYRENDIGDFAFFDRFTGLPRPIINPLIVNTSSDVFFGVGGTLSQTTLMANVLYDIPLGSRFKVTLGAGIGGDYADFDNDIGFSDNAWGFAYQGIVGLAYAMSPRTDLHITFRYLVDEGPDFEGRATWRNGDVLFLNRERFSADNLENETLTIGFRYDLQADEMPAPPPPPPPPPPPEPPPAPRQFLVFFGFNKSNLTAEAQGVVQQAAQAAKEFGAATVTVVGHTDTVGSPAYNMRLSERRANAVRSALVAQGIDNSKITASGRGETELMVQTGDGVKEPQNWRATIDM